MAKRTTNAKKKSTSTSAGKRAPAAKKSASKRPTKKAGAAGKKASKKSATKKTSARKTAGKKAPVKKAPVKKATGKKPAQKKKAVASKKPPAKAAGKKPVTKKASSKKGPSKAASGKKSPSKKPAGSRKAPAKKKPAGATAASKAAAPAKVRAAPTREEIKAEAKRQAESQASLKTARDAASRLAKLAGLPAVKAGVDPEVAAESKKRRLSKSPLSAKNLDLYRQLLRDKRREVAGNVSAIEGEALNPERSGSLSSLPQHMADQGSDEFDQALSLGIAASQRSLLVEIDAALDRIDAGVFGICELTGEAIHKDRLEATPWCRYSLEGARMVDRGMGR